MDYNKLRTFLTVAERGSVTAAARELGRTQSAVTQQVKLLEEELGFLLLERKHGRIFLTPQAERLVVSGKQSLGALDDEVARLKADLEAVEGTLAVGALDDYGTAFLGPRLARFSAKYPRVRLHVRYGTSREIERLLVANAIDLGVLVNFTDKALFETREVAVEEHVPLASRSYLTRRGSPRSLEALLDSDLLDFTDDFLCFAVWVAKNRKALLPRLSRKKPAVTLQSHAGVRAIVAAGFGVAMLPRAYADDELVEVLPGTKAVRVGHDLAWRARRTLRLVERLFIDELTAGG